MSGKFNPALRDSLRTYFSSPGALKQIAVEDQAEAEALRQLRSLTPGQLAEVMQKVMATIGIGQEGTRDYAQAILQIGINRVIYQLVDQANDPDFE